MQPRIKSPAMTLPGAMEAITALVKSLERGGVPRATIELMNMRASEIKTLSTRMERAAWK